MLDDPGVHVFSSPDSLVAALADWQVGKPFPVPDGRATARWRAALGGRLVGVTPRQWPGTVISCGAGASTAVARLLASLTGRPLHRTGPADLRRHLGGAEGPVALVGLPEEIEAAGDWPGHWAREIGLVTARDVPALVGLVYRTLTLDALVAESPVRRIVHPTLPGVASADAVEGAELSAVRAPATATALLVRGHGRECCVHLPDVVLCGRSAPPEVPLPPARPDQRSPSCLNGAGCVRQDLDPQDRQPVADLAGQVVFVESCNAVAVGANAMPHSVNIALAVVEGTAVGVIGPLGRHTMDAGAEEVLLDGAGAGARLGVVVDRLNTHVRGTSGDGSVFGLLGDPAMALPAGQTGQVRAAPRPVPFGLPADLEARAAAVLRVLRSLEALTWLGLPVPADAAAGVREQLAGVAALLYGSLDPSAARVGTALDLAEEQLHRAQRLALTRLADAVHDSFWELEGEVLSTCRQREAAPMTCPGCGRDSARLLVHQHRIEPDLLLRSAVCLRCGPLGWEAGSGPAPAVPRAGTDVRVVAGERTSLPVTVVNRADRPVRGTAVVAFGNGLSQGLPAPRCYEVDLPAGGEQSLDVVLDIDRGAHPDLEECVVLVLVDGVLGATLVNVSVVPGV